MTETQTFDLTELVEWEAAKNLPRARAQAWGITGLGVFLAAVGVYTGFFRPSHPTPNYIVESVVVIAAGLAIVLSGWIYPRALQRKSNLLIVTDNSLSFGRRERPPSTEIRWDDPGLRLVLQDGREVRARLLDRDRFAVFSLVPGNSPRIPLTEDAFNSVLSEVQRQGLTMKSQNFGGVKVTVVKPRPIN
jgi:hypothetical protein